MEQSEDFYLLTQVKNPCEVVLLIEYDVSREAWICFQRKPLHSVRDCPVTQFDACIHLASCLD